MEISDRPLVLVTHSGNFHADDAMAYALLRRAMNLGAVGTDHRLVRTRDTAIIASADIVWDVGFEYDADRMRYDHHQRDRPLGGDGMPLSAAGLVWRHWGERVVAAVLPEVSLDDREAVRIAFGQEVIRVIDLQDNGLSIGSDTVGLSNLIEDLNAPWNSNEAGNPRAADHRFLQASEMADNVLENRLHFLYGKVAAVAVVRRAAEAAEDPRILMLPSRMPWIPAAHGLGLDDLIYAIYPVGRGAWMVDAMPPELNSTGQRVPLPAEWAGRSPQELVELTGIPDVEFIHAARFCGSASSLDGALTLARRSLELANASTVAVSAP